MKHEIKKLYYLVEIMRPLHQVGLGHVVTVKSYLLFCKEFNREC